MGQPRPLFRLFSVFSNKHYNSYNKYMWKMSIQYTVPGFEPTTFRPWASSHNHWTRAPTPIKFFKRQRINNIYDILDSVSLYLALIMTGLGPGYFL